MSDLLTTLGMSMLLSQRALSILIASAPHRYKVYQIPKRTLGEFRTVAQPAREVKALQYWVMKHVLSRLPVHPAATAYRKGRSILNNATPHVRGRFVLKMDFEDFFPSIRASDFRAYLKRKGGRYSQDEVDSLCSILFWRSKQSDKRELCLSIGAPSSPLLSNVLLYEFDRHISAVCNARRVKYTRYADDLTFSAIQSEKLAEVETAVHQWCASATSPKLRLNDRKTVRLTRGESRRVTGLVLTNDNRVSVGREQKRRVRALMHHFVTRRLDATDTQWLRGTLAYLNAIEPSFVQRLRDRYGADEVARCLEWEPGRS